MGIEGDVLRVSQNPPLLNGLERAEMSTILSNASDE